MASKIIKIDKNNKQELKNIINEINEHIENRVQTSITLKFRYADMQCFLDNRDKLQLMYDHDSSDPLAIMFNLTKTYMGPISLYDIYAIAKSSVDNTLESYSFYFSKDGIGALHIEFFDEVIY